MLQKTSTKCKASEIKKHLERRIELWKKRDIDALLDEAKTIQKKLPRNLSKQKNTEELARRFAYLILEGKINSAIRLFR